MVIIDNGPSGVLDRFIGALLAFLAVAITLVAIPFITLMKKGFDHPYFVAKASDILSMSFFAWVGFISLLSLCYGASVGTTSVITALSHLWGTSSNPGLTERIWAILIISALITFSFLVNWNYVLSQF